MRMYGSRWMEAEHTEAEFAEEDADGEVQAARGLDPLMPVAYDSDADSESRLGGGETATDQAAELSHGV